MSFYCLQGSVIYLDREEKEKILHNCVWKSSFWAIVRSTRSFVSSAGRYTVMMRAFPAWQFMNCSPRLFRSICSSQKWLPVNTSFVLHPFHICLTTRFSITPYYSSICYRKSFRQYNQSNVLERTSIANCGLPGSCLYAWRTRDFSPFVARWLESVTYVFGQPEMYRALMNLIRTFHS